MPRLLVPILLAILGLGIAGWLVPIEQSKVDEHLADFPDAHAGSENLRPWVVAALCLLPAFAAWLYQLGGTIARYVTRQFLTLFAITFGALCVIWLLGDIEDNLQELKRSGNLLGTAAQLYSARLPELTVTLLPYSLMLSLLFCLGRLSGSREIVAMLQTGRPISRITLPFLISGFFAAALSAGLNFHWAPQSNAREDKILDSALGKQATAAQFVQFRNPRQPRLWMVGSFPPNFQKGAPLERVRVVTETPNGTLKSILIARQASWSPSDGSWTFADPSLRHIQAGEPPRFEADLPNPYVVRGWRETPAEIIQPGLPANQLGVPELVAWLKSKRATDARKEAIHLTQWHHRWAQPFNCVVVVLLATPLGIYFSRRATSGGLALAVFLCAGLLFFTTICLSLGDSGHVAPMLAAWLPNLSFGLLALYLFQRRLAGRPIYQVLRRLLPTQV
jgi:lipopolysaccharide export system permease protein